MTSASARCVYFPDSDNLVIRKPLLPSGYCEVSQTHTTSPSQQSQSRLFSGQCTATSSFIHSTVDLLVRGCAVPGLTRDVMEDNPGARVGGLVRVESFRLCCHMQPIRDYLDELLVSARALCYMKYTARRAESIG